MDSAQWVFFGYLLGLAFLVWVAWKIPPPPYVAYDRSKHYREVGEKLVAHADCQDYWDVSTAAKALGKRVDELRPTLDYLMQQGWVDSRWTGANKRMKREYFVTRSGSQRLRPTPEPSPTLQPTNAVQ